MNARNLFLYLLLANVLFFWWAHQQMQPQSEQQTATAFDENLPKLVLLGEEASPGNVPAAGLTDQYCFTVGPFAEEQKAVDWQLKLFAQNIPVQTRSIIENEPRSYWVYLNPLPSLAAAKQRVAELEQQGIVEHYIMREAGPSQYAISLGLYNRIAKARERLDELAEKQVQAQLDTRYDEVTYYWLDIQDDREGTGKDLIASALRENPKIRQLDAECSE